MSKVRVVDAYRAEHLVKHLEELDLIKETNTRFTVQLSNGRRATLSKERFVKVTESNILRVLQVGDIVVRNDVLKIANSPGHDYYTTNKNAGQMIVTAVPDTTTIFVKLYRNGEAMGVDYPVEARLFSLVEESKNKPVRERVPKKLLSDQEILDSIKIILTGSNSNFYVQILNREGITRNSSTYMLSSSSAGISCGIKTLSGLNNMYTGIRQAFDSSGLSYLFTREVFVDIMKKGFKQIFDNYVIGFVVMSTNETSNSNFTAIAEALESFDFITYQDTFNRNSNHNIRLWVADLYKNQRRSGWDKKFKKVKKIKK